MPISAFHHHKAGPTVQGCARSQVMDTLVYRAQPVSAVQQVSLVLVFCYSGQSSLSLLQHHNLCADAPDWFSAECMLLTSRCNMQQRVRKFHHACQPDLWPQSLHQHLQHHLLRLLHICHQLLLSQLQSHLLQQLPQLIQPRLHLPPHPLRPLLLRASLPALPVSVDSSTVDTTVATLAKVSACNAFFKSCTCTSACDKDMLLDSASSAALTHCGASAHTPVESMNQAGLYVQSKLSVISQVC